MPIPSVRSHFLDPIWQPFKRERERVSEWVRECVSE
jgi:hypothetical protein